MIKKKKTFSVKNSTYRHNLKPSPSFLPKGKGWVRTFICPTLNFTLLNSDPARTSCSALKKVPAHPRSQHKSQAEKWLPWHPDLLPDYYSGHSPSFSLNLEEGAVILWVEIWMYSQLHFFFSLLLLLIKTNKSAQQSLQSRGTRYSYLDTARPSHSFSPHLLFI